MNIAKHVLPALLLLAGMSFVSNVSAALIPKLGGSVVYDDVHGLTWLANANLVATDTFGVGGINADGTMDWFTAQSWIVAMNTADYLGFHDWRLPTALNFDGTGPCAVYYCARSELGNMFYGDINTGLGGAAGQSITNPSFHNANYDLFSNIQSTVYWSDTEYAPNPYSGLAWVFDTSIGSQYGHNKGYGYYAWAVRSGDVAAAPEPGMA